MLRLLLLGCVASLLGCASSPAQRVDSEARSLGFSRAVVAGAGFMHVVYFNRPATVTTRLHVYLDGDGSPWIRKRWVSADPTPRNPLMLSLMARDSESSVYLGRPCYHGFADHSPCTPEFWTHGRYSQRVVDSMAAALKAIMAKRRYQGLVFMGYSGGGALAMLLAERFSQTRVVITLAGNLDPQAWAKHHHYSPLWNSMNPTLRAPLPRKIRQIHIFGGRDTVVPIELSKSAVSKQRDPEVRIIAEYDHTCCWRELWPSVLEDL